MCNEYDILIFGGQSNMQGQTECLPEPNDPVEGALEYRFLTDSLIPLQHPVGEDLETCEKEMKLLGADSGHGSLMPACCRAYAEATGRRVVGIHAARGATTLADWAEGTSLTQSSMEKIRAGIKKTAEQGAVGHIYYLWLQGESDAIERTSEEEYLRKLIDHKDRLKKECGIHKFGIIEVGYFCLTATWLTDRDDEDALRCDKTIIAAQNRACEVDSDFVMLTRICKELNMNPEYINPFASGHFNNAAMEIIGREAGLSLAKLTNI